MNSKCKCQTDYKDVIYYRTFAYQALDYYDVNCPSCSARLSIRPPDYIPEEQRERYAQNLLRKL